MLQRLLRPDDNDICPNCGSSCLTSDVLCPTCGKNLDELYEQLPPGWTGTKPFLRIRPEFGLVAMWTVASAVVFAVGEMAWPQWGWLVNSLLPRSVFQMYPDLYSFERELTTGLVLGILQWMELRSVALRTRWWAVLTALGVIAAPICGNAFARVFTAILPGSVGELRFWIEITLDYFLGGVAFGFSQWIALRKLLLGAWRWILVAGLAWWLGFKLAYDILAPFFYPNPFFGGFVQWGPNPVADFIIGGSRGLVLGICTGLLLLYLLRHNGIWPAVGKEESRELAGGAVNLDAKGT